MTDMRRCFGSFPAVLLGLAVLVGCAAGTAAPPAEALPAAGETAAVALPPEGTVRLTGDLVEPRDVTLDDLAALPRQTVEVTFQTRNGPQQHTETGVLLSDLIPPDALATADGTKNDPLRFGVLATGSDGYAALVAYGEVSPDFGNTGILLATAEDGVELERPRLVVPGDVKGGRYVSDVVELRVVRVGQ